ncbi:ubiquitin carboxyl-terminal hydrolase MINDY-3-like isoform X2 [Paramacrobiotus metropolitanus]|uniref:ubiquitin carboxyl-terminal hydrolase MINDY-3-like isoform X2 n=1 Tax=Paramacrobiotus metropolitanus TaxID=2943436 RepID=UPI0024462EEE|nr:ubiquitin carboxyl-terminal hydrolase MINDY-3-like isoform X2 [Paramacrobiotus metropolitanus]
MLYIPKCILWMLHGERKTDPIRIPSKRDATAMDEVDLTHEENTDPHSEHGIHSNLRTLHFATLDDLRQYLEANPTVFCSSYGVLRFLYSVIISKSIEAVKLDLEDPSEPLIDGAHGHGNQSLINLLLTGSAVANVWDNEKEFGPLRLKGIRFRPAVGFLSLLENMRYVEVGFYYKCPQYPIWILGSETHLSILFTLIPSLVTSEAEEAAAVRVFREYDQHGSGFINVDNLGDVLGLLNLFKEDDYVNSLKQKLDKEHLGIILRSDFLAEFFPSTGKFYNGQPFDVYHYNGLARSESPIRYHHGRAKICELDFDLEIINLGDTDDTIDSDSAIVRCLRTKYPRVEITWDDNKIPSIN